ncbi:MAG TPA: DUF4349 domain-containing protein [Chloroflexia bacterium]|nr:DUF4349 domain-containing protein [Chloroflexia bacterium]
MNDSDWLERIRGLVGGHQRTVAHSGISREVRNRPERGRVASFLLMGFLALAVVATGFYGLAGRNAGSALTTVIAPADGDVNYMMTVPSEEAAVEGFRAPEYAAKAGQEGQDSQRWDRMIIRTATLQLRVKDVAASMDEIRGVVGGHAGYVTGSESRQEGESTVGTMTVQVPAAQFDAAISKLRTLGLKVLHENVTTSDVTEEYTDLNSQLRNLQATESRILALVGRAEQINDILALDRELRGIQGEIERIQGRLNFLGKRAEMSTITISLYPEAVVVEPAATPAEAWDPVRIANQAWDASLQLLANVGTAVITVVVYLWWLLPLGMLAAVFLRRARRTMPTAPAATTE